MAKKKTKVSKAEQDAANDVLKDMVASLNELPTEVLEQLNKNLDEIMEYNRTHSQEEIDKEWEEFNKQEEEKRKNKQK